MTSPGLHQHLRQSQVAMIAPQMRQSLRLLQAPALELRAAIMEELETNPVLEELTTTDQANEEALIDSDDYGRLSSFEEAYGSKPWDSEAAERRQAFFEALTGERSLESHLIDQIALLTLSDQQKKILIHLIGSLDDNGFLTSSAKEIAAQIGEPLPDVKNTIALLQTLEPVGIGAQDLQEALLIQLKARGQEKSLAYTLIKSHYALLMRRRVPELAKAVGVKTENISDALEVIATLDPSPGRDFKEDTNRAVIPEIHVFRDNEIGQWHAILENTYVPQLRISQSYKDLMSSGCLPQKDREYIRDHMSSGKLLIHSIEQRQRTIESIARIVVDHQRDFFENGADHLRPLTLQQVASAMDLHETTISRAVCGKYVSTPHGVFPLKYFFSGGYTQRDRGQTIASTSVKEHIRQLIGAESREKPLSDQALCKLLEQSQGTKIARRTVAKYREALGILPTHLRKSYN